jgi:hypothetical protein
MGEEKVLCPPTYFCNFETLMSAKKQKQNENKFDNWKNTASGGRIYWLDVSGRSGWKARYLKEVDKKESTIRFWQEIYNDKGKLVEAHEKFPKDKGHQKL